MRSVASWTLPDLCAAYAWPNRIPGRRRHRDRRARRRLGSWDMDAFFADRQAAGAITDVSVDGTTNSARRRRRRRGRARHPGRCRGVLRRDRPGGEDPRLLGEGHRQAASRGAGRRLRRVLDLVGRGRGRMGRVAAKGMESRGGCGDRPGWSCSRRPATTTRATVGQPRNVDLPASAPHVIGCGGTFKPRSGDETVWNNKPGQSNGEGTGGGYSTLFPMPPWQAARPGGGRMVPDVAADADPNTGYEIIIKAPRRWSAAPPPSRRCTPGCSRPWHEARLHHAGIVPEQRLLHTTSFTATTAPFGPDGRGPLHRSWLADRRNAGRAHPTGGARREPVERSAGGECAATVEHSAGSTRSVPWLPASGNCLRPT